MIFSVIVPFLNEETYIERCIKSLLNQDFDKREYEIIFVDNGSTDGSAEIVKRFSEIVFIAENKKYSYAARNKGLKVAKGEIIAFTDADCEVSKYWLSEIYNGMKRTAAMIAVGMCRFPIGASNFLRLFEDYENAKADHVLSRYPKRYFFGYTRNMAVRSEAFKKYGDFIKSPVLSDMEFVQRCISRDPYAKVVYLNDMQIIHLEITNIESWFKKINSYGEHSRHKNMPYYRPITYIKKIQIYKHTVSARNYGLIKKLIFAVLLISGDICYKLGRIKGFLVGYKHA